MGACRGNSQRQGDGGTHARDPPCSPGPPQAPIHIHYKVTAAHTPVTHLVVRALHRRPYTYTTR
eukprot:1183584-Prorocentrum_minimum.AAC.5